MAINISTSARIFRWRPACWLKVTGEDSATFLQGQFTNDLRSIPRPGAVYGLWLSVKGKVLADSFVLRGAGANEFWVGSYFSPATTVRERIESHVIADDVVVEDQTDLWSGVTLIDANTNLGAMTATDDAAIAFHGRRAREVNLEWVRPVAAVDPDWVRELERSGRVLDHVAMERLRIVAGIPAVPRDIGPADLPNEAGLEADAISYTKGCYLGQEVMARLKSMGQVRRRLVQVSGPGALPALPAAVFAGARQVGELRSATTDEVGGWIGLAMVSLLHLSPGAELAFAAGGPTGLRWSDTP